MRVALNLEQILQRPPGGIGRYAAELARVLPTLGAPGEVAPQLLDQDGPALGHHQGVVEREGRDGVQVDPVRDVGLGVLVGDLTVEPGSRAIIHGTVEGRIYNKGGRVEMFGMADAVENLSPDAATIIDAAAHILRGRRLETIR